MKHRFVAACAAVSLAAVSGCNGGGISVTSVNPTSPSYSSLQFALGTANLYGNGHPGLNVVSTLRQSDGSSAIGASTPRISGPMIVTAHPVPSFAETGGNYGFPDPYTTIFNSGPSAREWRGNAITGTPQTVAPGTPSCDGTGGFPPAPTGQHFVRCPAGLAPNTTSFGQSGGVFGMGLQPANAIAAAGQPYSYQPYPQPFYNTADSLSTYQFVPWGGPPAVDPDHDNMGTRDGLYPAGADNMGFPIWLGIGEGITVFDGVKARTGTYTLSVGVSVIGNGGSISTSYLTKQAHLDAAYVLPAVHAPVFHIDGKGGGTFSTTLPLGVTDGYVQIVDFGPKGGPKDGGGNPQNCQGNRGTHFAPVYYTVHVTRGVSTYHLPDTDGPNLATSGGKGNLKPSPSICTAAQNAKALGAKSNADDVVVQEIGLDYPMYQALINFISNTPSQNPAIANGAGRADITISQAMEQDNGSTTQTPLVRVRR